MCKYSNKTETRLLKQLNSFLNWASRLQGTDVDKAITTKARFGNKENQVSFFYFCLIGFDGLQHLYYKTIKSCARHE